MSDNHEINVPAVVENDQEPQVRVGVTAVIQNDKGEFLTSIRRGKHGAGTWQFPGGHMDFGEDPCVTAEREVKEETDLVVESTSPFAHTSDFFVKENKHYITLFAKCVMKDLDDDSLESQEQEKQEKKTKTQVPKTMEPDKCDGWHWKSWDELSKINEAAMEATKLGEEPKEALFLPLVNLMKMTSNLTEFMKSREA